MLVVLLLVVAVVVLLFMLSNQKKQTAALQAIASGAPRLTVDAKHLSELQALAVRFGLTVRNPNAFFGDNFKFVDELLLPYWERETGGAGKDSLMIVMDEAEKSSEGNFQLYWSLIVLRCYQLTPSGEDFVAVTSLDIQEVGSAIERGFREARKEIGLPPEPPFEEVENENGERWYRAILSDVEAYRRDLTGFAIGGKAEHFPTLKEPWQSCLVMLSTSLFKLIQPQIHQRPGGSDSDPVFVMSLLAERAMEGKAVMPENDATWTIPGRPEHVICTFAPKANLMVFQIQENSPGVSEMMSLRYPTLGDLPTGPADLGFHNIVFADLKEMLIVFDLTNDASGYHETNVYALRRRDGPVWELGEEEASSKQRELQRIQTASDEVRAERLTWLQDNSWKPAEFPSLERSYQRFLAHYRDGLTVDRVAATVRNDYTELTEAQRAVVSSRMPARFRQNIERRRLDRLGKRS